MKPRKIRTVYSELQLSILERRFQKHKYLSMAQRKELARNLRLSEMQVGKLTTAISGINQWLNPSIRVYIIIYSHKRQSSRVRVATPRFWDGRSWGLHEILLYPIMYRNLR